MLKLLTLAVLTASWPPLHGVLDVWAREPNSGFGGCGLLSSGRVACWPSVIDARFVAENWPRPSPVVLQGMEEVHQLGTSCGVTRKGRVLCLRNWNQPVDVGVTGAVEAAGRLEDGCALLSDGRTTCWGGSLNGRLGARPDAPSYESNAHLAPGVLAGLPPLRKLEFGAAHCGLTQDGTLWCWGGPSPLAAPPKNRKEHLASIPPASVPDLPKLSRFWAGRDLTIAATAGGGLLAWRRPSYNRPESPITIPGAERLAGATQVAFGRSYVVFLLRDGRAWLWGRDLSVPVNDAIPPGESDPLRLIAGLEDAVAVSAADNHVCFATRAGRARCMGRGDEGQLGDGSRGTTQATLVDVAEISLAGLPEPGSKTCLATRELRDQCLQANTLCSLMPVPEAGSCGGGAYDPHKNRGSNPPKPIGPCLCTCSREFRDAALAVQAERERCGRIP